MVIISIVSPANPGFQQQVWMLAKIKLKKENTTLILKLLKMNEEKYGTDDSLRATAKAPLSTKEYI